MEFIKYRVSIITSKLLEALNFNFKLRLAKTIFAIKLLI